MKKLKILVTGGAGFIGSNLVSNLLNDDRVSIVRVLDDLSNGSLKNFGNDISNPKFEFLEGDISDYNTCLKATENIDKISHQAALGSVPRSINNPMRSTEVNILGTVNILHSAFINNVERVILACSSSTYGDHPDLPKIESKIGNPLSPYAVTKLSIEHMAEVFQKIYHLNYIGLRYFNVFGPKQSMSNAYSAVIPIFCKAFLENKIPIINGDGTTSRDFTFVENVVSANILSLFTSNTNSLNQIYNVACNNRISLNQVLDSLNLITGKNIKPEYAITRQGDVKHSEADISKIKTNLHYKLIVDFDEGLKKTYEWYKNNL
jgi:UDP-N-acetylglucosamine 4-epimerase